MNQLSSEPITSSTTPSSKNTIIQKKYRSQPNVYNPSIFEELNQLCINFFYLGNQTSALGLMTYCLEKKLYAIGCVMGYHLHEKFQYNYTVINVWAQCIFYAGYPIEAYYIYQNILQSCGNIPSHITADLMFNSYMCYPALVTSQLTYKPSITTNHHININHHNAQVTIAFTSSLDRLPFLSQTIDSFLQHCTDFHQHVQEWLVIMRLTPPIINDHDYPQEYVDLQKKYSFIKFHPVEIKSECVSPDAYCINIIRNIIRTPYVFFMEDNWLFYITKSYISDCVQVLNHRDDISQCVLNRGYAESPEEIMTVIKYEANIFQTDSGLHYYEYKHDNKTHCPRFSLLPSLIHCPSVFSLPPFNTESKSFEAEFAQKYYLKGLRTVFLNGIYCLKISTDLSSQKNILQTILYDDKSSVVSSIEDQLKDQEEDRLQVDAMTEDQVIIDEDQVIIEDKKDHVIIEEDHVIMEDQKDQVIIMEDLVENNNNLIEDDNVQLDVFIEEKIIEDMNGDINNNSNNDDRTIFFIHINLDEHVEQKEKFESQFPQIFKQSANVICKRFPAINGNDKVSPSVRLNRIFEYNQNYMHPKIVGNALSHLNVYIAIAEDTFGNENDIICILEDNIEFVIDFTARLLDNLNQLQKVDWDLFLLGHYHTQEFLTHDLINRSVDNIIDGSIGNLDNNLVNDSAVSLEKWDDNTCSTKSYGGCFAYLITRQGARKILQFINTHGLFDSMDKIHWHVASQGNFHMYYARPELVKTMLPYVSIYYTDSISLCYPLEKHLNHVRNVLDKNKIPFITCSSFHEYMNRLVELKESIEPYCLYIKPASEAITMDLIEKTKAFFIPIISIPSHKNNLSVYILLAFPGLNQASMPELWDDLWLDRLKQHGVFLPYIADR